MTPTIGMQAAEPHPKPQTITQAPAPQQRLRAVSPNFLACPAADLQGARHDNGSDRRERDVGLAAVIEQAQSQEDACAGARARRDTSPKTIRPVAPDASLLGCCSVRVSVMTSSNGSAVVDISHTSLAPCVIWLLCGPSRANPSHLPSPPPPSANCDGAGRGQTARARRRGELVSVGEGPAEQRAHVLCMQADSPCNMPCARACVEGRGRGRGREGRGGREKRRR